jgi:hypothetical protein
MAFPASVCSHHLFELQIAAGPCILAAVYILGWGGDVSPIQARSPSYPPLSSSLQFLFCPHSLTIPLPLLPSQLLLTATILIASVVVAAVFAAIFWEHYSAIQLLGFEAASPDHRWSRRAAPNPSQMARKSFDFSGAAADVALGIISGVAGACGFVLIRNCYTCCLQAFR